MTRIEDRKCDTDGCDRPATNDWSESTGRLQADGSYKREIIPGSEEYGCSEHKAVGKQPVLTLETTQAQPQGKITNLSPRAEMRFTPSGDLEFYGGVYDPDDPAALRVRPDGNVYIHGRLVGNDREIMDGLREWTLTAMRAIQQFEADCV